MLRGYRGIFLAVGLIVTVGLGYIGHQLYQAAAQRNSDYDYQPASHPSVSVLIPPQKQAPGYQPNCNNPQGNPDSDLCAQWAAVQQVAESNRIGSFNLRLAIASLWATIIATGLLVWNLVETRATARRQLRAYVSHKLEEVKIDRDKLKMTYRHGFVNTGQTPAVDLQIYVKVYVGPKDAPEAFFQEHRQGFEPRSRMTLGAGMDTISPREFRFTQSEFDDVLANERACYMFGRATYRDVFDRLHFADVRRYLLFTPSKKTVHLFVMKKGNECS